MDRVLLPFPAQKDLALALAPALNARLAAMDWRRFPDGESLVSVEPTLTGSDVAIIASLDHPDAIALPLRFAAATAREMGARSVGLIAPYLAYLRQDARFHPGETVSAPLFARYLDESVDWLITVDPHLHRTASLERLFRIPTIRVTAAPAIADWIRCHVPDARLIGPDAESAQWVEEVAKYARIPWQALDKVRTGDKEVRLSLLDVDSVRGGTAVIVDDIISTGRTQAAALRQLRLHLPGPAICIATHAIFAGDAYECILEAGASQIISTDTIPHRTNAISIAPLLVVPAVAMFSRAEA